MLFRMVCYNVQINPTLSKTSNWQTLPTQVDFFFNSSCLQVFHICLTSINVRLQLIENNAKGAAVRSRARWMEYGKKKLSILLA